MIRPTGVPDGMTLGEYWGSEQYTKDCQEYVRNHADQTIFGGFTKGGYTHFTLPNGTKIAIPVSRGK